MLELRIGERDVGLVPGKPHKIRNGFFGLHLLFSAATVHLPTRDRQEPGAANGEFLRPQSAMLSPSRVSRQLPSCCRHGEGAEEDQDRHHFN